MRQTLRPEIELCRLYLPEYEIGEGTRTGTRTHGRETMDNLYAWRLGEAARAAKPGGDLIDYGWSIARELHKHGFDIVPRDRGPAGLNPAKTISEMCNFPPAPQS